MKQLITVYAVTPVLALLCLGGSPASAEWTVVNLHPAGATVSEAYGVSGGQQVGYAMIGGNGHAALWSGSAASWVDLHPAGAGWSVASGVSGGQQVGEAGIGGNAHAYLWSGTAASWVDFNPAGAGGSRAYGVSGGQQVGSTYVDGKSRASLWTGTGGSWVDLHPAGATQSATFGVSGDQQVGDVLMDDDHPHAGLWSGSAASWVDLSPAGAESARALGVSGDQQVGYANIEGWRHAGLWSGSAASWVDLHPAGATISEANGVSDGQQVGYAMIGGNSHAGLWSGTAASWVDLHTLLPAGVYSESGAYGIDVSAGEIWVAGYARNTSTGEREAMLWYYDYVPGSAPVYRFWSAALSRHFYTISEREKSKLINNYSNVWTYEQVAYYTFDATGDPDTVPVYRFWSGVLNAHFYTISESEKAKLINNYPDVWTYEGPVFYAFPAGSQPADASPVYRFWSDSLGCHFYTMTETEKTKLINQYSHVWAYEGIAWYAYP